MNCVHIFVINTCHFDDHMTFFYSVVLYLPKYLKIAAYAALLCDIIVSLHHWHIGCLFFWLFLAGNIAEKGLQLSSPELQ